MINFVERLKNVKGKMLFYKRTQESVKRYHCSRDLKDNKQTTTPKSEKLELQCIWVTEVFPPSKLKNLINSIKKLGWEYSEGDINRRAPLTEWIIDNRTNLGGGAWINGGVIIRDRDDRFKFSFVRRTKLPDFVDYAHLTLRTLTASLTLVTIQFVLKEAEAQRINDLIKQKYKTKVKYYPSLWNARSAVYINIKNQKEEAIQQGINAIHKELYKWFHGNLKGVFSSSEETKNLLPTVDMITSNFYTSRKKKNLEYLDALFRGDERWNCKEIKNLELRLSDKKSNFYLFGNLNLLAKSNHGYGEANKEGLINKLQNDLSVTIDLWALDKLIHSYEKTLSKIRDTSEQNIEGTKSTLKNLENTKNHLLSLSSDFQAINIDIKELLKLKRYYSSDAIDFNPPAHLKKFYPTFVEFLRWSSQSTLERIEKLEILVNRSISVKGNLVSAIANLKIQNVVLILTVVVLILTFVNIFFDIYPKFIQETIKATQAGKIDGLIEYLKR